MDGAAFEEGSSWRMAWAENALYSVRVLWLKFLICSSSGLKSSWPAMLQERTTLQSSESVDILTAALVVSITNIGSRSVPLSKSSDLSLL